MGKHIPEQPVILYNQAYLLLTIFFFFNFHNERAGSFQISGFITLQCLINIWNLMPTSSDQVMGKGAGAGSTLPRKACFFLSRAKPR